MSGKARKAENNVMVFPEPGGPQITVKIKKKLLNILQKKLITETIKGKQPFGKSNYLSRQSFFATGRIWCDTYG